MTGGRFLRCPTTEAHALHLANLKRLATADAVGEYLSELRRREGSFLARWVRDDFAVSWAATQRAQRKKAGPA